MDRDAAILAHARAQAGLSAAGGADPGAGRGHHHRGVRAARPGLAEAAAVPAAGAAGHPRPVQRPWPQCRCTRLLPGVAAHVEPAVHRHRARVPGASQRRPRRCQRGGRVDQCRCRFPAYARPADGGRAQLQRRRKPARRAAGGDPQPSFLATLFRWRPVRGGTHPAGGRQAGADRRRAAGGVPLGRAVRPDPQHAAGPGRDQPVHQRDRGGAVAARHQRGRGVRADRDDAPGLVAQQPAHGRVVVGVAAATAAQRAAAAGQPVRRQQRQHPVAVLRRGCLRAADRRDQPDQPDAVARARAQPRQRGACRAGRLVAALEPAGIGRRRADRRARQPGRPGAGLAGPTSAQRLGAADVDAWRGAASERRQRAVRAARWRCDGAVGRSAGHRPRPPPQSGD
ncbi:hypothetical protein NB713_003535 [Xanthomonas sacchari]|nr:hypothetical protein [Xanthomonas sacchari]